MATPPAAFREFISPWPTTIDPLWSVRKVKTALLEHECGFFCLSSQIVDAMGRDDRVKAVKDTRISGLLSLPFVIEPGIEEDEPGHDRAVDIASAADEGFSDWFERDELADLLCWYLMLGVCYGRIEWTFTDSAWTPRLVTWHPQWLRWDTTKPGWKVSTREGEVDLVPGEDGWFLMTRGSRGWMHGCVRAIAVPWLIRQFAWRDWARYNERHGMPILKGKVPASSQDEDKKEFSDGLRTMSSNATVTLPQNVDGAAGSFDLELLEASDRAWQSFPGLLERADLSIAVCILGQNLTTEVEGGSFAAAKIHDRIRMDRVESDALDLSQALRSQVLDDWVRFNFGNDAPIPIPRWVTDPPDDVGDTSKALATLGTAITTLRGGGIVLTQESVNELLARVGVTAEENVEPEPQPQSPTGQSEDDDGDGQDAS